MKQCTGCLKTFPATTEYFCAKKTGYAALASICKTCKKACDKAYYQAHKAEHDASTKAYIHAHPEERKAYCKTYYHTHKEQYYAQTANRRARQMNNGGTHTAQDVQVQYKNQRGKCYYCKKKVGKTYHVDHVVPLARGGSNGPENLVIACPACNQRKGATIVRLL